ncbi:SAM-dependent methyltransferase [Actinomadura harenae]|uniref:SAM-dependent methyltransferase n=2 Tax=Actinomadura harenae TaxID=2483351 RepID=A0A3M2LX21_9ACTN|nr:SAM-dependent methyltransferase [Actinomadura harenae]
MGGIDTSTPNAARIRNYWLGGKDYFTVDQDTGDAFALVYPEIFALARAERAFTARAVRWMVTCAGVRQFLDVGTGLPADDHTHQVAQAAAADCRVVYVDNDAMVLNHCQALLTSTPEGATGFIDADLHDLDRILDQTGQLLDFTQPIGLLFMGVLGHILDYCDARDIVSRLLRALPPGSYLALRDGTDINSAFARAQDGYNASGAIPYVLRSPQRIAGFFTGLDLIDPGVVPLPHWRPDPSSRPAPAAADVFGGIGHKAR